ncbi:MAG: PhnD/SsuA/transferrin family substrate-binding protein [Gammaproteobacteria bacterium]|nr:PhnD/SsuA/transferrin family substrate-binding protein [Gammaproteobacteria bacterium]
MIRLSLKSYILYCLLLFALTALFSQKLAASTDKLVKIAVLAHRGDDEALKRWALTADYLSDAIQGYDFIIKPKSLKSMKQAVENNLVEFILTNPGNYVDIEANYGATRIATIKAKQRDRALTSFSAVIFTRYDKHDINNLEDLRDKSFMAVNPKAFGGFQMAWLELQQVNINPFEDLSSLQFSGFPQDNIVYAVESGKVDAGTVRSDTLERMDHEGAISIKDFKILNRQHNDRFPLLHSTRLYPEWPFAKLKQTSDQLAQKVAVALLTMQADSQAAIISRSEGWTIPLDYTPVHEAFKKLKIGPYTQINKVTFEKVIEQYGHYILLVLFTLIGLGLVIVYIGRTNHNLNLTQTSLRKEIDSRRKAQAELAKHRDTLEQNVIKRTRELAELNEELQEDIVARKTAEASLKKSSHTLQTMHEITSSGSMSFEAKVDALLRTGCHCFETGYGALYQIKNSKALVLRFVGTEQIFKRTQWIDKNKLFASKLNKNSDALVILNAHNDEDYKSCFQHQTLNINSYLGIPVVVAGSLFGYLEYGSIKSMNSPRSLIDIDMLQLISQWIGGEIQRQQAQDNAQKHQADLAHVARLGTMGEMASGLAHELNQPLTAIVNYTRGCVRRLSAKTVNDLPAIVEAMEHSCSEAERAAEIIRRMRELVNKEVHRREANDINNIIEVVIKLVQPKIKQNHVNIKRELIKKIPPVYVDRIQIEQVLINLLNNAIDAMKNTPLLKREIVIQSRYDKHSIEIKVFDRGSGLPNNMRSDVFEPFFSTKNEGMGMGLSISRSIIEAHKGSLNAEQRELGGSVFSFTLPLGSEDNNEYP